MLGNGVGDPEIGRRGEDQASAVGLLVAQPSEQLFVVWQKGGIDIRFPGNKGFEIGARANEQYERLYQTPSRAEGKNTLDEGIGTDERAVEINTDRGQRSIPDPIIDPTLRENAGLFDFLRKGIRSPICHRRDQIFSPLI